MTYPSTDMLRQVQYCNEDHLSSVQAHCFNAMPTTDLFFKFPWHDVRPPDRNTFSPARPQAPPLGTLHVHSHKAIPLPSLQQGIQAFV